MGNDLSVDTANVTIQGNNKKKKIKKKRFQKLFKITK